MDSHQHRPDPATTDASLQPSGNGRAAAAKALTQAALDARAKEAFIGLVGGPADLRPSSALLRGVADRVAAAAVLTTRVDDEEKLP